MNLQNLDWALWRSFLAVLREGSLWTLPVRSPWHIRRLVAISTSLKQSSARLFSCARHHDWWQLNWR